MNLNIVKLWQAMLQLNSIKTDKGDIVIDGEVEVGAEVYVQDENGDYVSASDGEYVTDEKVIVVADGKVSEIKDKPEEKEDEPKEDEPVELSAKDKFNALKAQFEASYQKITENLYAELDKAGIYGYIIENGDDYAIVSIWDEESQLSKLYHYSLSVSEDGSVTLGESYEVKVAYLPVDESLKDKVVDEELYSAANAKIAELEAKIAEQNEKLEMSVDEPAKEVVKQTNTEIKTKLYR